MTSIAYELPANFKIEPFLPRVLAAEDAVARLDERVRTHPLRQGWQDRRLFLQATGSLLAEGYLIHLEDLVLFDAGTPSSLPTHDLSIAVLILKGWRKAIHGSASALLRGAEYAPPLPAGSAPGADLSAEDELTADWDHKGRLGGWRRVVDATTTLPPVLAAVILRDAWLNLLPEPSSEWRASLMAALALKARGKTRSAFLTPDASPKPARHTALLRQPLRSRIEAGLDLIIAATAAGSKELDALTLAAELLRARTTAARRHSRMPALIDLLLSRPLVSLPMAARHLGISHQAAAVLMRRLGSIPRELTGRTRYRAWAVP